MLLDLVNMILQRGSVMMLKASLSEEDKNKLSEMIVQVLECMIQIAKLLRIKSEHLKWDKDQDLTLFQKKKK